MAARVIPLVEEVAVDGVPDHTTYRLKLGIDTGRVATCYAILGSPDHPMQMPPAYQKSGSNGMMVWKG